MQIVLKIITGKDEKGEDIREEKIFVANKPMSRLVRKALTLKKEVNFEEFSNEEDLDKVVNFLCEVYNNKFTIDDVYDGLESDKLLPTLINSVEGIINGVVNILDTFPTK